MSAKKTGSLFALLVGLTVAFLLSVGTAVASSLTAADIDMLLALGLISNEKAVAAKANLGKPPAAPKSTAPKPAAAKGYQFTRDLQTGSKGPDVAALQNLLGVSPATGRFGALTKAAVIKYQMNKGISPATGYVGAKTRASLNTGAGARP